MSINKKKVTIKDIAKLSGVTPSTVSYILNNKPFPFKEETKKKVLEIAKQLGYSVNSFARGLVTGKTNTIGITFSGDADDAFSRPFFIDLISGMFGEISKNNYNIYFFTIHYNHNTDDMKKYFSDIYQSGKVDGLIIVGPMSCDSRVFEDLSKNSLPTVLIGRIYGNQEINIVDSDNEAVAYKAVKYLFDAGRKNVCIIGGDIEYSYGLDRFNGSKNAFLEYGVPFSDNNYKILNHDVDNICNNVMSVIKSFEGLNGIYAFDAIHALGVVKAVESLGLKIPDDIALITDEDKSILNLVNIPMTTVYVNSKKIGANAAQMIINKINNGDDDGFSQKFIQPELIVRKSV